MDAKITYHIEVLKQKHDELDRAIKDDYKNYVDDMIIEKKKKEKLALKDEIEKYIRTLN